MKPADILEIKSLELFKDMETSNFDRLMRGAYMQNFPTQIELITEGEPSDFLHIIVSGVVELFATWNRRETTMATIWPVSTFILAATIKDAPYLMSARTLQKSRVVLLPSQDVRDIFKIDAAFSRAVVHDLAQGYRTVVKNTKDLKLRSSIERLANYLLRQNWRAGSTGKFDLKVEKRLLASYLGMTPENLSRAIKALQPYGVTIDAIHVTISDVADLETLAKPTPSIDNPYH